MSEAADALAAAVELRALLTGEAAPNTATATAATTPAAIRQRIVELASGCLYGNSSRDGDGSSAPSRQPWRRHDALRVLASATSDDALASLVQLITTIALELDSVGSPAASQADDDLAVLLRLAQGLVDIGGLSPDALRSLVRAVKALLGNTLGQTLLSAVSAPRKPRGNTMGAAQRDRSGTVVGPAGRSTSGSLSAPRRRKASVMAPRLSTAGLPLADLSEAGPPSSTGLALPDALAGSSPRSASLSLTNLAPGLAQQQERRRLAYRRCQALLRLLIHAGKDARPPDSPAPASHWSKEPSSIANDLLADSRLPNATHLRLLGGVNASVEQVLTIDRLACPWDAVDPPVTLRRNSVTSGAGAGVGFTIILTFQLEDLGEPLRPGQEAYTELVNLVQLDEAGASTDEGSNSGPPLVGLSLSIVRRPGEDSASLVQIHYTSTSFAFAQPSAKTGRMPPGASTTVIFGIGGGAGSAPAPLDTAQSGSAPTGGQASSSRPLVLKPNRTYSLMLAHAAPSLTATSPSSNGTDANGAAKLPSLDMRTPVSLYIDGELVDVRRSVWPRVRPASQSGSRSPRDEVPLPSSAVKAEFGGTPAVSPLPSRQSSATAGLASATSESTERRGPPTWALRLYTPLYILRTHLPTSPFLAVGAGADSAFLIHQLLLPSSYRAHGHTHEPPQVAGGEVNTSTTGLGRFLTYAGSMRVNLRLDDRNVTLPMLSGADAAAVGAMSGAEAQRRAQAMAEHALTERRRRLVFAVAGSGSDSGPGAGGGDAGHGGGGGGSASDTFSFSLVAGKGRDRGISGRDLNGTWPSSVREAWFKDALDFYGERSYGMYLSLDFEVPYTSSEGGNQLPAFRNRTNGPMPVTIAPRHPQAQGPRPYTYARVRLRSKTPPDEQDNGVASVLQCYQSLADSAHVLGVIPALLDMLRLAGWAEPQAQKLFAEGYSLQQDDDRDEQEEVQSAPVFVQLLEFILLIIGGETGWRTSEEAERTGAWEVLKYVLERNARLVMSAQAAAAEGVTDRVRGWAADDECASGVLRVLFEAAGRRYTSGRRREGTASLNVSPALTETSAGTAATITAAAPLARTADDSSWALVNPLLYRLILLDVRVFRSCRPNIRQEHLAHFTALLRDSTFRSFNMRRVGKMGILRRLLSAWSSSLFDLSNEITALPAQVPGGLGFLTGVDKVDSPNAVRLDLSDELLQALRTLLKSNFSDVVVRVLTSYLATQVGRPRKKAKSPHALVKTLPSPAEDSLSSSSISLPASLLVTLTDMARDRGGMLDKLSALADIRWLIPIFANWNAPGPESTSLKQGLDEGRRIVSSSSMQAGLNLHFTGAKVSDPPVGGSFAHISEDTKLNPDARTLSTSEERATVVRSALQLLVYLCAVDQRRSRSARQAQGESPAQRNYSDRFNAAGGYRVLERYLPAQWNAPVILPLCWTMLFGLSQVPSVQAIGAGSTRTKSGPNDLLVSASAPAHHSNFNLTRLPSSSGRQPMEPDVALLDNFGPSRYVQVKNARALRLIVACWRQGLLELAQKEDAKRKYSNLLTANAPSTASASTGTAPTRPQHLRRRSRSVNFDAKDFLHSSDHKLLDATLTLLEQHCDREALQEEFRELLFAPIDLRCIIDAIVPLAHSIQRDGISVFVRPGSAAQLASRMLELLARLATESMATTGSSAIVDALLGAVPPMDLTQQSAFRSTLLDAVLRHVARFCGVDLAQGKAVPNKMLPAPTALHAFVTFIERSSEEFLSGLTVSVPTLLNLLAGLFDQLREEERRSTDLFASLKQHTRIRAALLTSMNRVFLCQFASVADTQAVFKSILSQQEWLLGPENSDAAFIECVLNRVFSELRREAPADSKQLSYEVLRAMTLARPPLVEAVLLSGKSAADVLQSGSTEVVSLVPADDVPYQDAWVAFTKSDEALRAAAHHDRVVRVKQLMDSSDSRQRSVQGTEAKLRSWHAKLCEGEAVKTARLEQDAREISRFAAKQQQEMYADLRRPVSILFEDDGRAQQMSLDPTEGPRRMRKKLHPLPAGADDESEPAVPLGHHTRAASGLDEGQVSPQAPSTALLPPDKGPGEPEVSEADQADAEEEEDDYIEEDANLVEEDEDDDKFRRVLRALDRGDVIEDVFNTSRVVSIECRGTLAIIGRANLYLLDDYFQRPNGELVDAWEAPAEERDAFVLATLASNAEQRSTLILQLDGEAQTRKWSWHDLDACFRRTWLHRKTALELFFRDGQSCLLVLPSTELANRLHSEIRARAPRAVQAAEAALDSIQQSAPSPGPSGFKARLADAAAQALRGRSQASGALTQAWAEHRISNFEYLMTLNSIAGRTYNDCTQYPVMPWILADYTSDELDLSKPSTFRDLSLPMGAQTQTRREEVEERYQQLLEMSEDGDAAFHYGTHYSTAAVVCAYLVRVRPFDRVLIALQGGTFDLADRTFSSIPKAWASASELSRGDVRELTPEFFYLPEMLVNSNKFDFGTTQAGQKIDNVELPPWAKGDPLTFVKLHRDALESDYVSANLHHWIDLIFGWRSRGAAAVAATNCFHPLSYETGINLETIESTLERQAAAQAIHNFGQTPQQLFSHPHPARLPRPQARQGSFTIEDQPWLLIETFARIQEGPNMVSTLAPAPAPCGVQGFRSLSAPVYHGTFQVCVGPDDDSLLICVGVVSVNGDISGSGYTMPPTVVECVTSARITCLASAGQGAIAIGSADGVITVLWLDDRSGQVTVKGMLRGHRASVKSIFASTTWSLVVTGSLDGTVMLWDLNRIQHVRSLPPHANSVDFVAVDEHHGFIATLASDELRVWTINGELLAEHSLENTALGPVSSLAFLGADLHSSGRLAVVLTGHKGKVASWECVSSPPRGLTQCRWALRQLYVFEHRDRYGPVQPLVNITAILASKTRMLTGDARGRVFQWALPASGEQACVQVNTESLISSSGGGCAECGKRFGVLEMRRTCTGCAGTFCGACAVMESGGVVRGHRFCSGCRAILKTLPLEH